MPAHKDLTGADLHEPKGVAAAAANTVYVANGAGSGAWGKVTSSAVDLAATKFNRQQIHFVIFDISVPGYYRVPLPLAGTLGSIYMVLSNAITIANETLYFQRQSDSAFLHAGAVTIPFATSGAGVAQYFTPTINNNFGGSDTLLVTYSGLSTGPAALFCTIDYALA
jgi:hypothetical protein